MINGNLKGIKDFIKKRIEELDGKKFDSFKFVDEELAQELAEITNYLNKELCVYLSRSGEILYINLGEEDKWRNSYKENCVCARAIEKAITDNYNNNILNQLLPLNN